MNIALRKYFSVSFLLILLFLVGCNQKQNNEKYYANVFLPLDGTWEGEFKVYIDTLGQREGMFQPKEINFDSIKKLSLKLQSVIKAKHIYKSVTSNRQEGEIIDILTNSDGSVDSIKSKAINLVKNGKLKCIVTKPSQTVIHDGEYLGNNTIVWQRSITNPLKIEYFKETVNDGHYKIIGWGYYGNDNPELTPRIWFYADYLKTDK